MTFKKRTVPRELEGCCTPMPGQQTLYNSLISNEEICQSTRGSGMDCAVLMGL